MRCATIGFMLAACLTTAACDPGVAAQATSPEAPLADCRVVDGDTLRCGSERVSLLGIDAPELPGHCRRGRNCAPGDPVASTTSLKSAVSGDLTIVRVGTDRYGRTLALVSAAGQDLSCHQLAQGRAIYRRDWDDGGLVASRCPEVGR